MFLFIKITVQAIGVKKDSFKFSPEARLHMAQKTATATISKNKTKLKRELETDEQFINDLFQSIEDFKKGKVIRVA